MPSVQRTVLVPYSAPNMFALVHDVESYPDFLPWCDAAQILARGGDELTARLHLSRGGARGRFSTRNRLVVDEQIDMELLDGPFHYLRGRWHFAALDPGTQVSLDIDYQFSNLLLGFVFDTVIRDICRDLVDAFEFRAQELYG